MTQPLSPPVNDPILRFRRAELDPRTRRLRIGDQVQPIQPRVFATLYALARDAPQPVSRETLLESVWPDVVVEEGSINRAIRGARRALGADPDLTDSIETIRGVGYRLALDVDEVPVGLRDTEARWSQPLASELVGRDAELLRLAEQARAALSGHRRVVFVSGEAGLGKSALIEATTAAIEAAFCVLEGRCQEGFGRGLPFLPLQDAMSGTNRLVDPRLAARLAAPRSDPHPSPWPWQQPLVEDRDESPERDADARLYEWVRSIELLSTEIPLALVLEDLHWSDASTLRFVEAIVERPGPGQLLLIASARPHEDDGGRELIDLLRRVGQSNDACEIALDPLDADQLATLAELRTGLDFTNEEERRAVGAWLASRTGGHPLFAACLADHIAGHVAGHFAGHFTGDSADFVADHRAGHGAATADGASPDGADGIDLVALEDAGLPRSLVQLVASWREGLQARDRSFIEVAAVCGAEFETAIVADVLGATIEEVEERCDALCLRGWLHPADVSSWSSDRLGGRIRFVHALVAEALHDALPSLRRARIHRAVACALVDRAGDDGSRSAEIALHAERGGDRSCAVVHHAAAALFASSRQASQEAFFHVERGLAEIGSSGQESGEHAAASAAARCDLKLAYGLALAARESYADDRVGEAFHEAFELARSMGDEEREASAAWGRAACLQMRGEIESAREVTERLLALARSQHRDRYEEQALGLLSIIAYFQGRFADCIAHGAELLERVEARGTAWSPMRSGQDMVCSVGAYMASAWWHRGDADAGRTAIEHAILRAKRLDHPFTEAMVEAFAAIFFFRCGDRERQAEHARRGLEVAEPAGIALWLGVCRFMEHCALPAHEIRLDVLRDTLESLAGAGGLGATFFLWLLADLELSLPHGERANARTLCQLGFGLAERTTENNNLPGLHLVAASLEAAEGNAHAAGEHLDAAEQWAERLGSVAFEERSRAAAKAIRRRSRSNDPP